MQSVLSVYATLSQGPIEHAWLLHNQAHTRIFLTHTHTHTLKLFFSLYTVTLTHTHTHKHTHMYLCIKYTYFSSCRQLVSLSAVQCAAAGSLSKACVLAGRINAEQIGRAHV